MNRADERSPDRQSRPLPPKPTRDDADDPERVGGALRPRSMPPDPRTAEELGLERTSFGPAAPRREPHVTVNERRIPPHRRPTPPGAPVLPANATGKDAIPVDLQNQPIDEESMYDRRPSEDKDRPPSES